MKSIFMECQCTSSEHTLKLVYDEVDKELYTEIHLDQYRNVFKRTWVAIKYIFGHRCRNGNWDCFLFKSSDIKKLQKLLERINSKLH